MQNFLYGKRKRHYQKRVFWMFLRVLGINTLKSIEITQYGNREQYYQENVSFKLFEFLTHQNVKTDRKHTYIEKQ